MRKTGRQPLGMNFNCAVRVGYTDDDLLKMLKDAGCLMVSLGIESADPEMLARHKSGVSLDEVRDTVQAHSNGGIARQGTVYDGPAGRNGRIDQAHIRFYYFAGARRHEHGQIHAFSRRAAVEQQFATKELLMKTGG